MLSVSTRMNLKQGVRRKQKQRFTMREIQDVVFSCAVMIRDNVAKKNHDESKACVVGVKHTRGNTLNSFPLCSRRKKNPAPFAPEYRLSA